MTEDSKNFGAYIDRTIKIIRHNYVRTFKELQIDITTEQWVIMDSLYQQNGISQTELANGSFKNAATVSRIIDLLCKKGITERQRFENDRRRHKIFLTPKGVELVEKVYPSIHQLRRQGWNKLSDEDYETFLRIMNQIFNNFDSQE